MEIRSPLKRTFYSLLILGRVSNLPTVWSNVLAGWYLSGAGSPTHLIPLLLGTSFLYIGGMFLNDFCDVNFDRIYRIERPIPSGQISRTSVGWASLIWMASGMVLLSITGVKSMVPAGILLSCIVIYDLTHKKMSWAPVFMATCRFLLYIVGATFSSGGSNRHVIFAGLLLASYVMGITYIARGESRTEQRVIWPIFLLLPPLLSSFLIMHGQISILSVSASLLFLLWTGYILIPFWEKICPSVGRVVSGLLAGIVLVDICSIVSLLRFQTAWFLILFILALFLQRVSPAT